MLNKGIETVTTALQTVVTTVEQYDESAQKREVIFGQGSPEAKTNSNKSESQDAAEKRVAV